jgi:fucose 4-O-acetylase-like acetyltransferase
VQSSSPLSVPAITYIVRVIFPSEPVVLDRVREVDSLCDLSLEANLCFWYSPVMSLCRMPVWLILAFRTSVTRGRREAHLTPSIIFVATCCIVRWITKQYTAPCFIGAPTTLFESTNQVCAFEQPPHSRRCTLLLDLCSAHETHGTIYNK